MDEVLYFFVMFLLQLKNLVSDRSKFNTKKIENVYFIIVRLKQQYITKQSQISIPDFPNSKPSSMESKRDTSKVPCKNFKAGNCRFGDRCNFSHEMCRFADRCTNNACNYPHPRDLGITPQSHKVDQRRPPFKPRGPCVPNNMALQKQIAELPTLLLGEATPEVKEEAVKKAAKHLKAVQKFLDEQTILLKRYSSAYEKMIEATMAASSTSEDNPEECCDEQEEDPVA